MLSLVALLSFPALAAPERVDALEAQEKAGALVSEARESKAARRPPLKVSDAVWRSSRLGEADLSALYDLGIKTILNLEGAGEHRVEVQALARIEARRAAAGLERRHIESLSVPMGGVSRPKFSEVDAALAVLSDPAKSPVLVHCWHGEDRTGVVVAAYRLRGEDLQLLPSRRAGTGRPAQVPRQVPPVPRRADPRPRRRALAAGRHGRQVLPARRPAGGAELRARLPGVA